MPGLSFLSKKSWHTSNISNQEKVWIAEQKAESESRRTKELLDQIKAEREGEEFDKLTGRNHHGGVSGDRGTNWMYEGGTTKAAAAGNFELEEEESRKNEAYLLGKEYVPEGGAKHTGDFAVATTMTGALEKASTYGATIGVGAIEGGGGGATSTLRIIQQDTAPQSDAAAGKKNYTSIDDYDNNHQEWNKEFHLRHEDPMFAVSQRRMAQEKDIQKKKRLMERAGLDVQILRRGEEISTISTTAGELVAKEGSKRSDNNDSEDRSRRYAKTNGEDSTRNDRMARRRHHSSSRSRRRRRTHDNRRMEKKRKRDRRSREDGRQHRHRRRHRSVSPSSASSSYSSSSYSSDSSTSSRSESSRSRPSHRLRHRSHRNKRDDAKSMRESDKYRNGERSTTKDRKRDSRAYDLSDDHRKSIRCRSDSRMGKNDIRSRREKDIDDDYYCDYRNSNHGSEGKKETSVEVDHDCDNANLNSINEEENGKRGFGLVGTTLSRSSYEKEPPREGREYLGPDPELLDLRRKEAERARQTRLNQARRR